MLYDIGVQTVLPPKFLCCGYPQRGAGNHALAEQIVTNNRVLFHRLANTLNYLDIKTVLVSCGTCMKQLKDYHFEEIFPGCRLMDIHDFLHEKGISVQGEDNVRYLYHDPCHTPFAAPAPVKTVNDLIHPADGSKVLLTERCCGESGTFAVGRPDIARRCAFKKEEDILKNKARVSGRGLLRPRQDPHGLPGVSAGLEPLQRDFGHQGRIPRRGDGAHALGRPLAFHLRRAGRRRGRHREGSGLIVKTTRNTPKRRLTHNAKL